LKDVFLLIASPEGEIFSRSHFG